MSPFAVSVCIVKAHMLLPVPTCLKPLLEAIHLGLSAVSWVHRHTSGPKCCLWNLCWLLGNVMQWVVHVHVQAA